MPIEGSKSISLWSRHTKAIEEYAKSQLYPPTVPQLLRRAVSVKVIPVKKLLGSPAVRSALLAISEEDEERVVLKSITVPDEVGDALVRITRDVKDDIKDYLGLAKEPSPTYCAGVWVLLFIETESPGFLSKYKKKELVAVG